MLSLYLKRSSNIWHKPWRYCITRYLKKIDKVIKAWKCCVVLYYTFTILSIGFCVAAMIIDCVLQTLLATLLHELFNFERMFWSVWPDKSVVSIVNVKSVVLKTQNVHQMVLSTAAFILKFHVTSSTSSINFPMDPRNWKSENEILSTSVPIFNISYLKVRARIAKETAGNLNKTEWTANVEEKGPEFPGRVLPLKRSIHRGDSLSTPPTMNELTAVKT